MDHHCPWMNNCIGKGNFKHFCLFLGYSWLCAGYALLIIAGNYFFCRSADCGWSGDPFLVQLIRCMMVLCIIFFLFTSSMLMNVIYGVITGIGTIDRMKKKSNNSFHLADEECLEMRDIFGVGSKLNWWIPIDPVFEDFGKTFGFVTVVPTPSSETANNIA